MAKVAIHLFHGDTDALGAGSHVAERVRQVARDPNSDEDISMIALRSLNIGISRGPDTLI